MTERDDTATAAMDELDEALLAEPTDEELYQGELEELGYEPTPQELADEQEHRALLDRNLDRLLWRLREVEGQIAANEAIYDDHVARAALWLRTQNEGLERRRAFFARVLEDTFAQYPLRGRERSRKLPSGTVGLRKSAGRTTIVDQDAAVEFALEHDLPIKMEVKVAEVKAWAATPDPETGEVRELPPFVTVEGAGDNFYYKAG